eukprot:m.228699 g.228699  ORF g.228699 m.228699 type:complete len:367 (+) comp38348_c0_seq1:264-1364(+)
MSTSASPGGGSVNVVFLRTPDTGSDRYHTAATRAGLTPHSVPVIACRHDVYRHDVYSALASGPDVYSGLVVTSHQAVDAAVEACRAHPERLAQWGDRCVFALGRRTASAVARAFGVQPIGAGAASAQDLASVIVSYGSALPSTASSPSPPSMSLSHTVAPVPPSASSARSPASIVPPSVPSNTTATTDGTNNALDADGANVTHSRPTFNSTLPLLFLCSSIARSDLPETLDRAGMRVHSVVAYATESDPDAGAAVASLVSDMVAPLSLYAAGAETSATAPSSPPHHGTTPGQGPPTVWLAFFSPSGVAAVAPALKACEPHVRHCLCMAALGATTASALRDAGLSVDAVAPTPTPDALIDAIVGMRA